MSGFYYVVKSSARGSYWNGDRWCGCQYCAKRFSSRRKAHKSAHGAGQGHVVMRVRRKQKATA